MAQNAPFDSAIPEDDNRIRMVFNLNRRLRFSLCVLAALALGGISGAQENSTRRLILKDGSYQIVTKYEVKGDRVHYYSSEREEWEDLPNSLVDWPATDKWEKDRAATASSPEAVQLDKELEEENQRQEALLPLVAPGLRLPENSGVFLLESFQGQPQIAEVQQSAGDINNERKGNIFRGAVNPIAGLKVTIELDGAHAKLQSHVGVPSVYINTNDDPGQADPANAKTTSGDRSPNSKTQSTGDSSDRFRIVKLDVKGNKRILGDVKRQITGKVSQEQHFMKSTTTPLNGGWLKITPAENLAPGEYALVEMMGKEGMNLYVWDFGVNPKAPANPNTWKPEVKVATPSAKPDNQQ